MPTALIVDDHPAIRVAVRAQLEAELGFSEVREACNGAVGLQALRERAPALVVVDLDLPGLPGDAVVKEIVSHYPPSRVLVLSAMPAAPMRALQAGAHGYIAKGRGLQELVLAVRALMAGFAVFPLDALDAYRRLADGANGPTASLSRRELTVLRFLASGHSNKTIAEMLDISHKTVSSHKTSIMSKLHLGSLIDLAEFARVHQLLC